MIFRAPARKHPAVFRAGIPLDTRIDVDAFEKSFKVIDHFLWSVFIGLGATEIYFSLYFMRLPVRRISRIGERRRDRRRIP